MNFEEDKKNSIQKNENGNSATDSTIETNEAVNPQSDDSLDEVTIEVIPEVEEVKENKNFSTETENKTENESENSSSASVEQKEEASFKPGEETIAEKTVKEDIIEIYTDGACSGNPGPGGWAALTLYNDGTSKEIFGGEKLTTNNKMELLAAIKALSEVKDSNKKIKVYTDSMYVKQGITEWIKTWKLKNYKDVKNIDLWKQLDSLCQAMQIEWVWIKSHAGHAHNELVDKLAREQSMKARNSAV